MIELVEIAIIGRDRCDIVPLALALRRRGLRLRECGVSALQLGLARRSPQGVIEAHRHAPIRDGAGRIGDRRFVEGGFGLRIFE
jgi:hypothetical protein